MTNLVISDPQKTGFRTAVSVVFLLAFGLELGIYSWISLGEPFDAIQILDLASLVFLTGAIFVLFPRARLIRNLLLTIGGIYFILVHIGFIVYCRFYRSWPTFDIFGQWGDLKNIMGSIEHLVTGWDIAFGLVIPSILFTIAIIVSGSLNPRPLGWILGAAFLACQIAFGIFSAYPYIRQQSQPFLYMYRTPVTEKFCDYLPLQKSRIRRIDENLDTYYPIASSLYRADRTDQARLRKAPDPGRPERDVKKMNVLVVILESTRANESGLYGAPISFTPNIDKLGEQSLVFDRFYSNGHKTAQAECAVHCSVFEYANSGTNFRRFPNLKLNCLPAILRSRGYNTIWLNSYKAEFANAKQFLQNHGFREFHDIIDLKQRKYRKIGWGPSDQDLYRASLRELNEANKPFYAEVLTLSNHFPFTQKYPTDKDMPPHPYSGAYADYLRGIFYTDYALGEFIRKLQLTPWFHNTILVVTGDHGVWRFPDNSESDPVQKNEIFFRIPCLIYTPRGIVEPRHIDTIGSHVDIAPTLMDILGIEEENSFVGRSLLRGDEGGPRYALMLHDEQWNIRRGDEYCVEVNRLRGEKPLPGIGVSGSVSKDPHFCFHAEGDLLRREALSPPSDNGPGNNLVDFGRGLVTYNRYLLRNDIIYRDPDGGNR